MVIFLISSPLSPKNKIKPNKMNTTLHKSYAFEACIQHIPTSWEQYRSNPFWTCCCFCSLLLFPPRRLRKPVGGRRILTLLEHTTIDQCLCLAIISCHTWKFLSFINKVINFCSFFSIKNQCFSYIPCWGSTFLLGFSIFSSIWIWIIGVFISGSKQNPSFNESVKHPSCFSLHIQLQSALSL